MGRFETLADSFSTSATLARLPMIPSKPLRSRTKATMTTPRRGRAAVAPSEGVRREHRLRWSHRAEADIEAIYDDIAGR